MTRKPTPKPARKPPTAAKPKAAPSGTKSPKAASAPATGQAAGYVFQIGPTKSVPGSRLKGAGK